MLHMVSDSITNSSAQLGDFSTHTHSAQLPALSFWLLETDEATVKKP